MSSVNPYAVGTKKIDDHFVWLKSVSKDYLNQLPAVPLPAAPAAPLT
jgi:hypothetical protein